ncbi:MAG TPA: CpaD family pilus assembly protein [Micropepsaceae bacterium]|nr:CpaD family pilus assembly protein [Micropepsaceae bacterium]
MPTARCLLRGSAGMGVLFLVACTHGIAGTQDGLLPQQRFPISFEPQMQVYRLPYDPDAGSDPVMQRELYDIGRDYEENGAGSISVSAAAGNMAAAEQIAGELSALGVPRTRITVVPPGLADVPHTVAIGFVRYRAVSPPCGNWSENLGITYDNRASPNFGCATQHNIAAMIADPRDLAAPEPEGTEDAMRRLTVLGKYQQGAVTGATKSIGPAESVGISAVGKGGGGSGGM